MKSAILSVLVTNHFGVLTRVTNLFGRRGFNIKALSVGETENPALSRITILTEGDHATLDQIQKQLSKLEDVKKATIIPDSRLLSRELVLIKVRISEAKIGELEQFLAAYDARIVSSTQNSAIVKASNITGRINELIAALQPFGILEMARTGPTALELGEVTLSEL